MLSTACFILKKTNLIKLNTVNSVKYNTIKNKQPQSTICTHSFHSFAKLEWLEKCILLEISDSPLTGTLSEMNNDYQQDDDHG